MGFAKSQESVDQWIKTIGVRYFSELTNMAVLTEEVGELARLISRKFGDQSFKTPLKETEIKERIGEELSDILFVVLCLANQMDIDLDKSFLEKMNKKTERDKDRHQNNPKLKT